MEVLPLGVSMRFSEIGQQLRAFRLESGMRAEEIAARLGVSRAALYRYEKGEVIKLDTVKRMAELLNLSPLTLLGVGVEYYGKPIAYFERLRQLEETVDQVLEVQGPVQYLTTSEGFDAALLMVLEEAGTGLDERERAEHVLTTLAARKRMYAARRPTLISILPLSAVRRFLHTGLASSIPLPEAVRRRCLQVALNEVRRVADMMEAEPMGLQFGVLAGPEPTSVFSVLRDRDKVWLAINPFLPDGPPTGQTGVAMITAADDAVNAHQRVAETSWRQALKGAAGAAKLRELIAEATA